MYILSAARSKIVYVVIMTPVTHPEKSFTLTLALLQAIRCLNRAYWGLQALKEEKRNVRSFLYLYASIPQQDCLIFLCTFSSSSFYKDRLVYPPTFRFPATNIDVVYASSIVGCFDLQCVATSFPLSISLVGIEMCAYIFFLYYHTLI